MKTVIKNVKYISSIIVLAVFGMVISTSCSDDDDNNNNGLVPIRLSSSVELGNLRLQDLQIVAGQELSFFVTTTDDIDDVRYENQRLRANGTGGFTYQQTMYYPTDGSDVDFYAVHPYLGSATLDDNIDFSVATNQSTRDAYLNSDLLYAMEEGIVRTLKPISMAFTHKMAKLDFVIIQGDGADISGLNAVEILSAYPSTSIDLANGNIAAPSGTRVDITPYGLTTPAPEAQRVSGISAIIVPQTFPSGQRLFLIRLGDIEYFYTPSAAQGLTFQGGYRYTLELTINQASIELESSIANWTNGGTIEGEGSIGGDDDDE